MFKRKHNIWKNRVSARKYTKFVSFFSFTSEVNSKSIKKTGGIHLLSLTNVYPQFSMIENLIVSAKTKVKKKKNY